MRVNPNFVPDIVNDLSQSQTTLNTLLQEVATGKSVSQPSDNPSASAQMVQNSLESSDAATFTQNVSGALVNVQSASAALSSVVTQLSRAVTLGTEGANGTNNSTDLSDLAQQIQSILSTVVSQANTSVEGVYLFGGTASGATPYTASGSSPSGYVYNGDNGTNSVAVGDNASAQVNLPGSQIFSTSSNGVISSLSSLSAALTSGNTTQIETATAAVDASINVVSQAQGFYSNAESQLNSQETFLQQETVTLSTQQNNLVGANEATVATELSQAETDNSAALAAAAKVLPATLLNYLSTPT